MRDALNIQNLNKKFKNFQLNNICLKVPKGRVVGLIGENGSGKSTTMRCVLNQDIPESGTIEIYGRNAEKGAKCHDRLGVVGDSCCFPDMFNAKTISAIMKDVYEKWSPEYFFAFLKRFSVPEDRQVRQLSKGMKAKLNIACALAHQPELLLLDEATAGLDPVVREEILDLLQEFMEDENHGILITSHITSDIERIADSIYYIQDGQICFELSRDQIDLYGIAQLTGDQIDYIDPNLVKITRKQPMHMEALITDRYEFMKRYPDYAISPASLDSVIVMISKGEVK
ncbi:ABC transporter ATP-binding protein [Erysipelotrichaceae bacterium RD49]|nr:ABC transporter ATP-binding protein [Erysipelotrichaceae bacterium RD49]